MISRREFVAGVGFWVASSAARAESKSPNEKLNLGIVGVGGMRGGENLNEVQGQNIAALCDVDDKQLERQAAKFPKARMCNDFRKMLDEGKDLDAVVVSTPDHQHAFVAMAAIKLGKHVYCEKPLTHSVWEARQVAEAAAKAKVATQMGTQIHAGANYRRVVEVIQSGAIGAVREVHVWNGVRWFAKGLPKETPPPPPHLHWDLWLGPAEERPYNPAYHPQGWRSYWNFGGGHLGDMGCHFIDLPFWALNLRHPLAAEAQGTPVDPDGGPEQLHVTWTFPARGEQPPVKLTWWHGNQKAPVVAEGKAPPWGAGVLFEGDKGRLAADYGRYKLLPEESFKDFKPPEKTIPDSIGHHHEWIRACKGEGKTLCNFDYSGALTESVLLGNVAYRTGRKIEWDAAALKAKNCPEADAFIRREYRKGWAL